MRKIWLVTLLSLVYFSLIGQEKKRDNKKAVLFGEHLSHLKEAPENVIRIYLDKDGFYYPDHLIEDKSLKKSKSSLALWYEKHPDDLAELCRKYKVEEALEIPEKINRLNDSIIQHQIRLINDRAKSYESVDVLIHGFRKKAYGNIGQFSTYSSSNNDFFRRRLSNGDTSKRLFVEIYWDSKFVKLVNTYKFRGYKLFERSGIPNAKRTGRALRKLIPYFQKEKVNIISHSLGAVVATELAFNADAEKDDLPTPAQSHVNLCFIAPAVGWSVFENYYSRNSSANFTNSDNYRLSVLYNDHDFVLLKQFEYKIFKIKSSPLEYGDTTLGCNYEGAIGKMVALFETKFKGSEKPLFLDCSFSHDRKMTCHSMVCYARHAHFKVVREFL